MRRLSANGWLLVLCLFLVACEPAEQVYRLSGPTMGTSWNVTLVRPAGVPLEQEALVGGITSALEAVNASMSTYREDSEISRFNLSPRDDSFAVSADFATVLSAALQVGEATQGAYDITVGPLVNLWGFGPGGMGAEPPQQQAVEDTLRRVGQQHLQLDVEASRISKTADVYLDLSSIAKGYAVDKVATWLQGQGITDFLVEVGGEMRVAGQSPRGDAWRVAIEQPDASQVTIARAIRLADAGVATSGDYRNFFEVDGQRYSHSIDPRTGQPVAHELVSVTVVHPSTMMADAWATALTIMGAEPAWTVAQQQGLAVYLIERDGDGFSSRYTESFAPLLEAVPETEQ